MEMKTTMMRTIAMMMIRESMIIAIQKWMIMMTGDDSDNVMKLTKRIMKSTQTTMRMIIVITKLRRARMTDRETTNVKGKRNKKLQ